MILLLLVFIIQHTSGSENDLLNSTLPEIRLINELEYEHESKIIGLNAEFSFTIHNTTYARDVLGIDSYYFSITFINEQRHEQRINTTLLDDEEPFYGQLNMKNLEEEDNYLICVFFLNDTQLIGSSRFCHVVSVSDNCKLETAEGTFTNRTVYVLLIFVVVILLATFIFTCIRAYVYRPKTIEAILETLPDHQRQNLEKLAPTADERRRRRTQVDLDNRLREDSVLSINYQPDTDADFRNYYAQDNVSLDIVHEDDETM
jgi:hypothetical protein